MRIIGCLSLFFSVLIWGWSKKLLLHQKVLQWREMRDLLQFCSDELKTSQRTCNEIIQKALKKGICDFFLSSADSLESTLQNRLFLAAKEFGDPELQGIAISFAEHFGTTDSEQQLQCFQLLRQRCDHEYEQRRKTALQDEQLIIRLSISCGAALVILLL